MVGLGVDKHRRSALTMVAWGELAHVAIADATATRNEGHAALLLQGLTPLAAVIKAVAPNAVPSFVFHAMPCSVINIGVGPSGVIFDGRRIVAATTTSSSSPIEH